MTIYRLIYRQQSSIVYECSDRRWLRRSLNNSSSSATDGKRINVFGWKCTFKYLKRFVFIMGTTVSITFQSVRRKKIARLESLKSVLRRSVILFILGLVLSNRGRSREFRVGGSVHPGSREGCDVVKCFKIFVLAISLDHSSLRWISLRNAAHCLQKS